MSREHTFPDWINSVLTSAILGPGVSLERTIAHGPQAGASDVWPVARAADHTVRVVCVPCNGGWMSSLERQAKSLLEPMILGRPASLTPDDQIAVATWATLKTAVFEYAWGDQPVLTQADRTILMTQGRPPANVQVRLAAVESNGTPLLATGRGYQQRGSTDIALCLTLSIGCVVLQVFGGPGAVAHQFQTSGSSGPAHIGIYPPAMTTVHWPPAVALDDASLRQFANPFGAATHVRP
jgi:hypothetical protein